MFIKMKKDALGSPNFVETVVYHKDEIFEVVDRPVDEKTGRELPGNPGEGKIYNTIADGFLEQKFAEKVNKKGKADRKSEIGKEESENKMETGEDKAV